MGQNPRKILLMVLSGLMVLGLPATAQAQLPAPQEKVKVVEIQIEGNEHVRDGEIKAALPFKEGDEITLPDDLERAALKLRDLGLLKEVTSDWRRTSDGIVAIFEIVENPVIQKIEIHGNRDWNEDRRFEIPFLGLSTGWPFVDYLVSPQRMKEILKEHEIEPGKVLNTVKLKKALGVEEAGNCAPNPPSPSLCGEYQSKGYFLFGIADVQAEETLTIRVVEGVIEFIEVQGVEGPIKEEALKMLSDIPVLRPVTRQKIQDALQRIAQSIYFEPLRPEDFGFESGSAPDRVKLRLTLKERRLLAEPQVLERIRFVGNTAFSEEELLRRITLPEGLVDNYQLLKALEGVYRLYRKDGYFLTKFTKEELSEKLLTLRVDEGRIGEIEIRQNGYATARITKAGLEKIPVEKKAEAGTSRSQESDQSGQKNSSSLSLMELLTRLSNFLGQILGTSNVSGLPRTQPEIIAKDLALKPGQLANQFLLADTYRKLLDSGYFTDVNFDFQPMDSAEMRLIIEVAEQEKLGSLNGGFSLSPEGLVGKLSVSGKNLYGMGQDVSIQFDRGILGKAITNWKLEYQSRTLIQASDYVNLQVFNNTSREGSPRPHLLNRVGAEASLAYPWEDVQLIFGFRHETFTKDFESGEAPQLERGLTNALSLTVNHDDRNNPIFATRGGIRSIRMEQAGLFVLGTEFTKLQGMLIQHFPTFEDQNVAIRLVGGFGVSLPSQEEFLLGGSTTLRGITTQRTPSMVFTNLEYRIQFVPGVFSVALFADLGTDSSLALKKSVGIEGRFFLPYVGLVRLAFAWPITHQIEYVKIEFGLGPFF